MYVVMSSLGAEVHLEPLLSNLETTHPRITNPLIRSISNHHDQGYAPATIWGCIGEPEESGEPLACMVLPMNTAA